MKKFFLFITVCLFCFTAFAQQLNYQVVVRDNNQQLVTNTAVKADVLVKVNGTQVYAETVNGTTNLHGLLDFAFGNATFSNVDWPNATISVTVKNASTEEVYVPAQDRVVNAVPYALNAANIPADLENQIAELRAEVEMLRKLAGIYTEEPESGEPCLGMPTLSDRDGNTYNTVQLGTQCWMKENLRTTHYSDGTAIALGDAFTLDTTDVLIASAAYRYCPDNDNNNVAKFGYLYNWNAVMRNAAATNANPSGVQGVCPTGWHVPSKAELTVLVNYLCSRSDCRCGTSNQDVAKSIASVSYWLADHGYCTIGNNRLDNNASGFTALPAGVYTGSCCGFGVSANFWTTSQYNNTYKYYYNLAYDDYDFECKESPVYRGFSVRCLKN